MSNSPQRRRSSVKVGFVEDVNDFQPVEIKKDQWDYAIQQSNADVLRKFLKSEADREFSDLQGRVSHPLFINARSLAIPNARRHKRHPNEPHPLLGRIGQAPRYRFPLRRKETS